MLIALEKEKYQAQEEQQVPEGWVGFAALKWVLHQNLTELVTFERLKGSNKTRRKISSHHSLKEILSQNNL